MIALNAFRNSQPVKASDGVEVSDGLRFFVETNLHNNLKEGGRLVAYTNVVGVGVKTE